MKNECTLQLSMSSKAKQTMGNKVYILLNYVFKRRSQLITFFLSIILLFIFGFLVVLGMLVGHCVASDHYFHTRINICNCINKNSVIIRKTNMFI